MATLIIGSTAMAQYVPDMRKPKDFDCFTNEPQHHGDTFWHPSFITSGWLTESTNRFATLSELYTLKVSHSSWELRNGSWDKHMSDVVTLKRAGAVLDLELYGILYKVWEEKHGKKRVNLNQDKEAFFTDAVRRIYDHDSIHYSVAYGDKPIYEEMFVEGKQVAMDMSYIKAMPLDKCIRLYREEIYATALERWVIPSNYTVSPRLAYARAVKKTITSLTKGWSSRFIIENFEEFRGPDIDYVTHHKAKSYHLIPLEI